MQDFPRLQANFFAKKLPTVRITLKLFTDSLKSLGKTKLENASYNQSCCQSQPRVSRLKSQQLPKNSKYNHRVSILSWSSLWKTTPVRSESSELLENIRRSELHKTIAFLAATLRSGQESTQTHLAVCGEVLPVSGLGLSSTLNQRRHIDFATVTFGAQCLYIR